MSKIESFTLNISKDLGKKLNKNNEEIAVLNYGLFTVIHTAIALLCTAIIGIITNTLPQILTITIASSLLKRYSGGVHATSPERCTLIGIVLTCLLAKVAIYIASMDIKFIIIIGLALITICYYILYKKCPVPSKNKPMKNEGTRKKLRKKAFGLVNTYILIVAILIGLYLVSDIMTLKSIVVSIILGMGLQVFVLTKIGGDLIKSLDNLFNINKLLSKKN